MVLSWLWCIPTPLPLPPATASFSLLPFHPRVSNHQRLSPLAPPPLLPLSSLPNNIPSLPLGALTLTVMMSPPATIIGGITWHMGGLTLAMLGLGCLQIGIQALRLSLVLVVLLISRGAFFSPTGCSSLYLPTRQSANCFWVCPACHGIDGVFSWWYRCATEFFVSC